MVTILKNEFRHVGEKAASLKNRLKEKLKTMLSEEPPTDKFNFRTFFSSLQAKMMLTYLAIFALIMVLLNTYPIVITRNLVFDSKESSMKAKTNIICTAVSGLDSMTTGNVRQAIENLEKDGNSISGLVVTNSEGITIYEKNEYDNSKLKNTKIANFGIGRALKGEDVFYSTFTGGVFASCTSIPITENDNVIGVVHLYEYDDNQGEIILDLMYNFRRFTAIVAGFVIILSFIFSNTITKRMRMILEAIKYVREGDYGYRVAVSGKDEVAQLAEEFNSLTGRLQTTEETRRRFVSDASHELKTPLASIRLLSDSILQNSEIDAETVKEFVEDIGNEAERLARTTEKLLNLTRLDNKIVFKKQNVDIKRVAKSTMRMLEPIADNYEVSITADLEDGCIIYATEDDVYQVIMNLVENAIKYNFPGGNVHIELSRKKDKVLLVVEDTGIGIPEADIPNIFDRFYRVDKARSRASGGTGLGLSIVKSTIEEHGGTISVHRREQGGTRFEVVFNCIEPDKNGGEQ